MMRTNDAMKAAGWTAVWTFAGMFGMSLIGWLQDVASWASSSGARPMPGLSVLGYAAVSAAVAAVSGLLSFAVRSAQARGIVPGNPPSFSPQPAPDPEQDVAV